jgi:hypothetical protein
MTDNDKLNAAFKELDYEDEAFSELEKQLQRKVAHGVTDGSQHDPIAELEQENRLLRARNDRLTKQALHDENVRLGLYEQGEPVAWMDVDEKGAASGLRYWSEPDNRHEVALYSAPQQSEARGLSQQRTWVGLTEGEIVGCATGLIVGCMDFARAIETKLKEKNT